MANGKLGRESAACLCRTLNPGLENVRGPKGCTAAQRKPACLPWGWGEINEGNSWQARVLDPLHTSFAIGHLKCWPVGTFGSIDFGSLTMSGLRPESTLVIPEGRPKQGEPVFLFLFSLRVVNDEM